MKFWKLLLLFLHLGAGEDGNADPPEADPSPTDPALEDAGTGDDTLDDLLDAVEPTTAPKGDKDEGALVKEARRRADAAERALADERSARSIHTPQRAAGDPEFDREEAELAAYRAKPDATQEGLSWLQWKIDSNRKMRASERNSSGALAEAREIADRSAFERLEVTKPKIFKTYAKRVEDTIADLRSKGQQAPPRLALLRFLVGDDLMNGKIKPKAAKAAPGAEPTPAQVPRGRTPGTRSDVSGRQKQSEREARRERLRNTTI